MSVQMSATSRSLYRSTLPLLPCNCCPVTPSPLPCLLSLPSFLFFPTPPFVFISFGCVCAGVRATPGASIMGPCAISDVYHHHAYLHCMGRYSCVGTHPRACGSPRYSPLPPLPPLPPPLFPRPPPRLLHHSRASLHSMAQRAVGVPKSLWLTQVQSMPQPPPCLPPAPPVLYLTVMPPFIVYNVANVAVWVLNPELWFPPPSPPCPCLSTTPPNPSPLRPPIPPQPPFLSATLPVTHAPV